MPAAWGISNNGGTIVDEVTRRTALEAQLGKFSGQRRNLHFGHGFPMDELRIFDSGYPDVYRNQDSIDRHANPDTMFAFADVAKGVKDAYLRGGFTAIRDAARWTVDRPYHFSFHHEQTVNESWQPRPPGTPADYAAAFRHVHDLCAGLGAHVSTGGPVRLVFNVLQSQVVNSRLAWYLPKCDPGPDAYDVLGVDFYNKRDVSGITGLHYGTDAAEVFEPFVEYAVAAGKPWGVHEFSIAGGDQTAEDEKAAWIDSFRGVVEKYGSGSGPGQLAGIYWTDEGGTTSVGRPVTSPQVLDAMLRLRAATYQPPPVSPPPVSVF